MVLVMRLVRLLPILLGVCLVNASTAGGHEQTQNLEGSTDSAALAQGKAALLHGDLVAAETIFHQAVREKPSSAEFRFWLGVVYLKEGKADSAEILLRQATT